MFYIPCSHKCVLYIATKKNNFKKNLCLCLGFFFSIKCLYITVVLFFHYCNYEFSLLIIISVFREIFCVCSIYIMIIIILIMIYSIKMQADKENKKQKQNRHNHIHTHTHISHLQQCKTYSYEDKSKNF